MRSLTFDGHIKIRFKTVSVLLTACFAVQAVFAGCSIESVKTSETDVLSDAGDNEWFDVTFIDIASEYDSRFPSPYTFVGYDILTYDPEDETVLLMIGGDVTVDTDEPREQENIRPFLHLNRYRFDGSLVEHIDISSMDSYYSEDGTGGYSPKAMIDDDRENSTVTFLVEQIDWSDYSYQYKYLSIDMTTGEYYISNELEELNSVLHNGDSVIQAASIGDKCIFVYGRYDYGSDHQANLSSLGIVLLDEEGAYKEVDRSVFPPLHEIQDIFGVSAVNDEQLVFMFDTASEEKNYLYDISTEEICEISISEDIRSDLNRSMYNLAPKISGIVDEYGFTGWDSELNEFHRIIDVDECNVNVAEFVSCLPVAISDEQIVLGTSFVDWGSKGGCRLYALERSDNDPREGKTLINIAPIGGLEIMSDYIYTGNATYELYETIRRFNDRSEEYYVRIDNSYLFDTGSEFGTGIVPLNNENLTAASEQVDRLAIDLRSGDGPDMIFGPMDRTFLENSDYLMDLMSVMNSDPVDTTDMFEEAVFGRQTGDSLYAIALDLLINCISIDSRIMPPGTVGLTFDDYRDLVDTDLNGYDTVLEHTYGNQIDYFFAFFEPLYDDFVSDGQVDLNNDEFRSLCEFVNDSYVEIMCSGIDREEYILESDYYMRCFYSRCGRFGRYYSTFSPEVPVMTFVGMPSSDGRGITLSSESVIAVAAHTDAAEGCWEFIKFALSEEIQELFGTKSINRNVFERSATSQVEITNLEQNSYYEDPNVNQIQFDPVEMIDSFETAIDNSHGILGSDPSVRMILAEELPAYFEGSRSLDEIIPIIEDRCQTVLDERG